MTIQRMEHVGIVVDDLAAATAFCVELGHKLRGEGPVEGGWVEIAIVETPDDGHGLLELAKFTPRPARGGERHAPANTPGIRLWHSQWTTSTPSSLVCEVERNEESYRLCYVRGPEGIIVELAEQIG